jgi:hypothetical protein
MKNMQKRILKFLISLSLFIACHHSASSQIMTWRLRVADSLFAAKKYTESFEHYEAIFKNSEFTETMLLRMSLIQEGLRQPGKALYYLNLYYLASGDPAARIKMNELAEKHGLQGYEGSDNSRIFAWYYNHHFLVTGVLAGICLLLLALAVYIKTKDKQRPVGTAITLGFFVIVLFAHTNLAADISVGIVASPNTYLMEGPSAGANVVEIIEEGHRVEVIDKKDVWLKILWRGSVAYAKEDMVQPVSLSVKTEL